MSDAVTGKGGTTFATSASGHMVTPGQVADTNIPRNKCNSCVKEVERVEATAAAAVANSTAAPLPGLAGAPLPNHNHNNYHNNNNNYHHGTPHPVAKGDIDIHNNNNNHHNNHHHDNGASGGGGNNNDHGGVKRTPSLTRELAHAFRLPLTARRVVLSPLTGAVLVLAALGAAATAVSMAGDAALVRTDGVTSEVFPHLGVARDAAAAGAGGFDAARIALGLAASVAGLLAAGRAVTLALPRECGGFFFVPFAEKKNKNKDKDGAGKKNGTGNNDDRHGTDRERGDIGAGVGDGGGVGRGGNVYGGGVSPRVVVDGECACIGPGKRAAVLAVLAATVTAAVSVAYALNTIGTLQRYRILYCMVTFTLTMIAGAVFRAAAQRTGIFRSCCGGCVAAEVGTLSNHLHVLVPLIALSANPLWYGWPGLGAPDAQVAAYAASVRVMGNEFFVFCTVSWLFFELVKAAALAADVARFRGDARASFAGHGSEASPETDFRLLTLSFATLWINPITGAVMGALLLVSEGAARARAKIRAARGLGDSSAGSLPSPAASGSSSSSSSSSSSTSAAEARKARDQARQDEIACVLSAAPAAFRSAAGYVICYATFVLAPSARTAAVAIVQALIIHSVARFMGPDV